MYYCGGCFRSKEVLRDSKMCDFNTIKGVILWVKGDGVDQWKLGKVVV